MADRPQTLLEIAKFALNGWACYAKTERELDEIGRLHTELKALADAPVSAPPLSINERILRHAMEHWFDDLKDLWSGNLFDWATAPELMRRAAHANTKQSLDRLLTALEVFRRTAPAVSGEPPPNVIDDFIEHGGPPEGMRRLAEAIAAPPPWTREQVELAATALDRYPFEQVHVAMLRAYAASLPVVSGEPPPLAENVRRAQLWIAGASSMGGMVGEALLVVRHILEGETSLSAAIMAAEEVKSLPLKPTEDDIRRTRELFPDKISGAHE